MSEPATAADLATRDGSEAAFRRRLFQALAVGSLTLVVLIAAGFWLYRHDQDTSAWVDHTYSAEAKINALSTLVERTETVRRGYLLEPRDGYWRTYVDTRARLRPAVEDLREYTSDNPRQTANLADLEKLIATKFAQLRESIELAHDGDLEGGRRNFLQSQEALITERLRLRLGSLLDEEQRLLDLRQRDERASSRAFFGLLVVVTLLLAMLATVVVLAMRRFTASLQASQAALRTLNAGLETRVRERTADLSRANEEIQRFAYIVSHDLRSPLVNVMGFTSELEAAAKPLNALLDAAEAKAPEAVTPEVRLAIREEIPESLGFIRTSTKKMDRLINAILALSRQGRRTLAPERLDMTALVQSAADSLAKLAEDKGAEIVVEAIPPLVSDRVAVEQVLSNLMENAVKYAQPGRAGRVVVRGALSGGRVLVEVEDNGRGVAPRDHERIFELFRRSGAQDTPGEGIGLANVRALVYRLGGTIACISELGQGATFRVSLPERLEPDQGSSRA